MKNQIFVRVCFILLVAGCSSEVSLPTGIAAGGGGSSEVGGSGGGGGAGGASGTMPAPCVVDPMKAEVTNPSCTDLAAFTLENPQIVDDSGDGIVSAGEGATISISIRENFGKGFTAYPGILFSTDHGAASISPDAWLFSIAGCETGALSAYVTFSNDITKGTVVNVTARVAMLGADCPDSASIVIPIKVF